MGRSVERSVDLRVGRIVYRVAGSGEPIVFVHGLLTSGRLWAKAIFGLEDRFCCLAPDWPMGSHTFAMRDHADLSPAGQAGIVIEFLDALGLETVTLVGNDTGGGVCQQVAIKYPERVARLVLTPCDAFENYLPLLFRHLKLAARVRPAFYLTMQALRIESVRRSPLVYGWVAKRRIDGALQQAWVTPVLKDREVRRDVAKLLRAMNSAESIRVGEALRRFEKPTLVVWDRHDHFFPLADAYRLRDTIADCRLEILDDSLSFVPMDQPDPLAAAIAGFIG
jgi:pimeloyl-ACP methyl ester carboxylesterase